jgi:hypothetical protein
MPTCIAMTIEPQSPEDFEITATNSLWVFVSLSQDDWHVADVVFGAGVLIANGVPSENIVVFTDRGGQPTDLRRLGVSSHSPSEMSLVLSGRNPTAAVVVAVTGHGLPGGLGQWFLQAPTAEVRSSVETIPGVKVCVWVLGQCYANAFRQAAVHSTCRTVLMGATQDSASISVGLTIDDVSWCANVFFVAFFLWLRQLSSGDDKPNHLAAAFASMIVTTESYLERWKNEIIAPKIEKLVASVSAHREHGEDPLVEATEAELQKARDGVLHSQAPWVLGEATSVRVKLKVVSNAPRIASESN